MYENYTWDMFVAETNNIPNNTQKQVLDISNTIQYEIYDLISHIPPAENNIQKMVVVYIYKHLGSEGFRIFNNWYRHAVSTYPGSEAANVEYESYAGIKHSVDKDQILKLVDKSDNAVTPFNNRKKFEKCPYKVIYKDDRVYDGSNSTVPCAFDKHSLRGKSQDLAAELTEQVYVLDQIALSGQSTVIFAAPNTGKTLITLSLLIDAIQEGRINADNVYYLNLDDSLQGLMEKVSILEDIGAHVIADGHQGFNASKFAQQLDEISRNDQARDKIIILDTLKKFIDVMSKSHAAVWGKTIRRFTSKGGTIISLAHVNKKTNSNGKPVNAGVSDFIDDCDTAYTMQTVNIDEGKHLATVEFENQKRRGDVATHLGFMISTDPKISYEERLASVELVDQDKLEKIKITEEIKSDDEIILIAINGIKNGFNTKMRLRDTIAEQAGISRRKALNLIEKYEGSEPDKHKWNYTVHERGMKVYYILEGSSEA